MDRPLQRILYIDDEPDLRELVSITFELTGAIELRACASAAEAQAALETFAPDLLLIDVMMPGLDGPATLELLRHRPGLANVPAVFFTAKVLPQEIDRLSKLGAAAVLKKPFDPLTLLSQLEEIWRAHRP